MSRNDYPGLPSPERGLQPTGEFRLGSQLAPATLDLDQTESSLPISHYLWVLRRHAWKIIGFVMFVVTATIIISARLEPIYEATASVYVDRQEAKNIVGSDSEGGGSVADGEQFLATQMKMIQSDSVVRPIAQRYDLLEKEDQLSDDPDKNARAVDAPIVLKKLRVGRPPNTYLLQISYRSPDAQLAADVANGVATSYMDHTYNIRTSSSVNLSRYMEKQTEEMRAKMELSSERLAKMERELNVVDPEEKVNILSRRLIDLNSDFAKTQTDLVVARAAYESVGEGSLEAVLLSQQSDSLRRLIERRNEQNERFAQTQSHFGPNHPEYRKAAAQLKAVDEDIEKTRERIVKQSEVEYKAAQSRERMIKKNLEDTKAESDRLNVRSFEYRRVKQEAEADKKLYDELVRKIREAGINASFQNNAVRIADSARAPWKPVFPNMKLNILLAFLFSSLLAIGSAILADAMDNTIREPEEAVRALNTSVIGTLPAVKTVKSLNISSALVDDTALVPRTEDRQLATYDEAIRTLRSSILLTDFDRRLRTLLLSSATAGEGKSTTAAHLAYTHAEQKKKTIIIDCDLRRPTQHKLFGVAAEPGLSSVLNGNQRWQDVLYKPESNPYLHVITAGPPSRRAADMIGSSIPLLIDEMSREYDLIILDAPPILGFAESLQMAAVADGVIVVTRAGETSRKAVSAAIQTLHQLRANVVGLVLNQVKKHHSDNYYYYGYYGKNENYHDEPRANV